MTTIRYWFLPPSKEGRACVVLTSILGPEELLSIARARDGNGTAANKAVLGTARPPVGATHYRDDWRAAWKPVEELQPS